MSRDLSIEEQDDMADQRLDLTDKQRRLKRFLEKQTRAYRDNIIHEQMQRVNALLYEMTTHAAPRLIEISMAGTCADHAMRAELAAMVNYEESYEEPAP